MSDSIDNYDFTNFINDYEKLSRHIEEQLHKVISVITDVRVIVPNKVVEVTFTDGAKEKSVCQEPDVFSLETAISICIAKHLLGGTSRYNKAIKKGIKVYENKIKQEAAEMEEQERITRKREKKQAYKERRAKRIADKKREEQIAIQKEAYLRAMEEYETWHK